MCSALGNCGWMELWREKAELALTMRGCFYKNMVTTSISLKCLAKIIDMIRPVVIRRVRWVFSFVPSILLYTLSLSLSDNSVVYETELCGESK